MLDRLGVESVIANDEQVALEVARDGDFQLILIDCQMPNMGGFSSAKAIREADSKDGRRTPAYALTAGTSKEDKREASETQMDGFMAKCVLKPPALKSMNANIGAKKIRTRSAELENDPRPKAAERCVKELRILLDEFSSEVRAHL